MELEVTALDLLRQEAELVGCHDDTCVHTCEIFSISPTSIGRPV